MDETQETKESADIAKKFEALRDESDISISFTNLLFALSAIIIAILAMPRDKGSSVLPSLVFPSFFLILTMLGSFYSSLFYANVATTLRRKASISGGIRALHFGDIISEYFGVYPLVIAFPLTIWDISHDNVFAFVALVFDIAGLVFYLMSKSDISSLIVEEKSHSAWVMYLIPVIAVIQLGAEVMNLVPLSQGAAAFFTLLMFGQTVQGVRSFKEK